MLDSSSVIALMSVSWFEVGTADQPNITSLAALVSFRTACTALWSKSILVIFGLFIVLCDNYASMLLVVPGEHTISYQCWLSVLLGHGVISTWIHFHYWSSSCPPFFALSDLLNFVSLIRSNVVLARLTHCHDTVSSGVLSLPKLVISLLLIKRVNIEYITYLHCVLKLWALSLITSKCWVRFNLPTWNTFSLFEEMVDFVLNVRAILRTLR